MPRVIAISDISDANNLLARHPGHRELGIDLDSDELYINRGTKEAPEWAKIGGSSQSICLAAANGLVKDWAPPGFDPDVTTHLIVDPTAQPWEAGKVYSMGQIGGLGSSVPAQVTKVTPDGVRFQTCYAIRGTSGGTPPSGSGTFVDGELEWGAIPYDQFGWLANHATDGSSGGFKLVAAGAIWFTNSNGNTGATPPDWTTAPNRNDQVVDGDITWLKIADYVVWAPDTQYEFAVADYNYQEPFVLPPTPEGNFFALLYVRKPFVASGLTEPDWDEIEESSGLYATDGEILWKETTDQEQIVLTGITAPSAPRASLVACLCDPADNVDKLVLVDGEDNVVGAWGAFAESSISNRVGEESPPVSVPNGRTITLIHTGAHWRAALAVT